MRGTTVPGARPEEKGARGEKDVTARSYLYVPADRPDLLTGALGRGADAIIVDLEDAVAERAKDEARRGLAAWLAGYHGGSDGPEVWVRVNNRPGLLAEDLAAVTDSGPISGVSIPKVERHDTIEEVADCLPSGAGIIGLIESAQGVLEAAAIASSPHVVRLALGEADLVAHLGVDPSVGRVELVSLRMGLVVASAAAGVTGPIAPVSTDYRDLAALRTSTEELKKMGFGARSAIHPDQVAVINEAFTPSAAELEEARRLIAAADQASARGAGVFIDEDGRMVDEAVVRSARNLVAEGIRRDAPRDA